MYKVDVDLLFWVFVCLVRQSCDKGFIIGIAWMRVLEATSAMPLSVGERRAVDMLVLSDKVKEDLNGDGCGLLRCVWDDMIR